MFNATMTRALMLVILVGQFISAHAQEGEQAAEPSQVSNFLPLNGRVTDGDRKLENCVVSVYRGNELVEQVTTDRAGKFQVGVAIGDLHTVEFTADGFMHKRVVVDTRADLPDEPLWFPPMVMDVSLIDKDRYDGADIDVLDMPFAIVQFDPKSMTFVQDAEYSTNMMRTHGALLLMAGRVGKN